MKLLGLGVRGNAGTYGACANARAAGALIAGAAAVVVGVARAAHCDLPRIGIPSFARGAARTVG